MGRMALRTLFECLTIVAVGLVVGLVANAASDRGIALGKDHLRRGATPQTRPTATLAISADRPDQPEPDGASAPADGGLFNVMEHDELVDLYEGPDYCAVDIIIDARNDSHYLEGHIPGAFQLDHYRAERYLTDELLQACQWAERIVVYCSGGTCEDSRLAAEDLMLEGVEPAKIFIYEAGINGWLAQQLPLEVGPRLSGEITYGDSNR
jgi:rhodanese-related sulfurtransferase